ncbi:MAG: dTMP kinase [Firmicutes bacterium]|nr:dTMP kinase [Bacillota bacterium]
MAAGKFIAKGSFIVFEGIDGAGKTTQMRLLAGVLESLGLTVLCTREPGGTGIGTRLRELLLDPACRDINRRTEAFLYAADRAQHINQIIKPALQRGDTVLCDRYLYSTLAYQGGGRGLDTDFLLRLNTLATGGLEPDVVVLLDLPAEEGIGRVLGHGLPDRLESEKTDFFRQVRRGYLEQAARRPGIFRVVQAGAPAGEVHRRVLTALEIKID